MFVQLQSILGSEHEHLAILLSFIYPEECLPIDVLDNPLRKSYADAIEMIFNIEVSF